MEAKMSGKSFRVSDGDWICPDKKCGNVNFARRTNCNRCGREKTTEAKMMKAGGTEIGKTLAEKSRGLFSANDWQCKTCGNVNWARRSECNMCNTPKYAKLEERTGYGGGFNERENVEYIEREESDGEYDEFGRKKKKYRGKTVGSKSVSKDNEKKVVEPVKDGDDDEDDDDDEDGDLSKYKLDLTVQVQVTIQEFIQFQVKDSLEQPRPSPVTQVQLQIQLKVWKGVVFSEEKVSFQLPVLLPRKRPETKSLQILIWREEKKAFSISIVRKAAWSFLRIFPLGLPVIKALVIRCRTKPGSSQSAKQWERLTTETVIQLMGIMCVLFTCWSPLLMLMVKMISTQTSSHHCKPAANVTSSSRDMQVDCNFFLTAIRMASLNQILDPWVYLLLREILLRKFCQVANAVSNCSLDAKKETQTALDALNRQAVDTNAGPKE
ncbi:hypothetical protein AAFF_G00258930 [Aldrovandia affinis]|uniref:Zinc finger Ran-binding domain-containing protein 2 n=1 Tax=Aldrovandia affinis TaxID=143900 RepID=A0AAD7WU83_9TELE|nr:hypothetical protein AAFF_G00258930 [Aldrovandia affinis]